MLHKKDVKRKKRDRIQLNEAKRMAAKTEQKPFNLIVSPFSSRCSIRNRKFLHEMKYKKEMKRSFQF